MDSNLQMKFLELSMNGIESWKYHGEFQRNSRELNMNYNNDGLAYFPECNIPEDRLKQLLSTQLQYYFSKENLANDTYLLSQMDDARYVPIWTVANFNQIKRLTKDIQLITEVLRESPNVEVDEEGLKVRPMNKRCIVILRETPENTPIEDIKALFVGENCPKLLSVEHYLNDMWLIKFKDEEDAERAYTYLREEVREFQGKPIAARIRDNSMKRLQINAVPSSVINMKNSYHPPISATNLEGTVASAPSPIYEAASLSYQPQAHPHPPASQQRFLYTNSSALPPTFNYTNQLQIYALQQQPFYHPSMLPHWGPTGQFFDFGSVFPVNGLAPQSSFPKAQNLKYHNKTNNSRNKTRQNDYRNSMSESGIISNSVGLKSSTKSYTSGMSANVNSGHMNTKGLSNSGVLKSHSQELGDGSCGGGSLRTTDYSVVTGRHTHESSTSTSNSFLHLVSVTPNSQDCSQQLSQAKDTSLLQRRRKKDEDTSQGNHTNRLNNTSRNTNEGNKFDLEANSFPPLPSHNAESTPASVSVPPGNPTTVANPLDRHDRLSPCDWENGIVPVNNVVASNKSKTEDILNSNGVLDVKIEESSRSTQSATSSLSSENRADFFSVSSPEVCNNMTNTQSSDRTNKTNRNDNWTSANNVSGTNQMNGCNFSSSHKSMNGGVGYSNGDRYLTNCNELLPKETSSVNLVTTVTVTNCNELLPKGTSSVNLMTTVTVSSSSNGAVRLSYAQVAQHHKEKNETEKQASSIVSKTSTSNNGYCNNISTSMAATTPETSLINAIVAKTISPVILATTAIIVSGPSVKCQGTNSIASTSSNDSERKENNEFTQSVPSKQGGGSGSSAVGGNVQKDRPVNTNRQNESTIERERDRDHMTGKNSRKDRQGEQSLKLFLTP